MSTTAELENMAKAKGRPRANREEKTVRIEASIASRAKSIADAEGKSVSEVLSDILRAPIAARFAKVLREVEREGEG